MHLREYRRILRPSWRDGRLRFCRCGEMSQKFFSASSSRSSSLSYILSAINRVMCRFGVFTHPDLMDRFLGSRLYAFEHIVDGIVWFLESAALRPFVLSTLREGRHQGALTSEVPRNRNRKFTNFAIQLLTKIKTVAPSTLLHVREQLCRSLDIHRPRRSIPFGPQ